MMLVNLVSCMQKNKSRSLLPCPKLISKWIKDLNIRADVLNLIEEKVKNRLQLIVLGIDFQQDANSTSIMIINK